MRRVLLVPLLALACRPTTPPAAPDAAVAAAVPDAGCNVDGWTRDIAALAQRAATGASVVARDGCALFDGKLLARGFPSTEAAIKEALTMGPACEPTLKVSTSQVTFVREEGVLKVARVRNLGDEERATAEAQAASAMETDLLQAARCPRAEKRLRTEEDANMARAYALAADTLQTALRAVGGNAPGPDLKTVEALERICANVPSVDAGTVATRDREPFAAMSMVMAGSFTLFGKAAQQVKLKDPALDAVRPAAAQVLAQPPVTNHQGVCATWGMARAVMDHNAAASRPAGKKKRK